MKDMMALDQDAYIKAMAVFFNQKEMIKFKDNIGVFFSSNYFDEDFVKKVHSKSGYSFDDQKELQKRITPYKISTTATNKT